MKPHVCRPSALHRAASHRATRLPKEDEMTEAPSRPRSRLLTGVLLLLLVGAGEGIGHVGIAIAPRIIHERILPLSVMLEEQTAAIEVLLQPHRQEVLDSVLGWTLLRGTRRLYVTTQGLRGFRIYKGEPADSILRVAAFGDSFVYGTEVYTDSAWAKRLEFHHPSVEVLNYGVGGYGTDQAHLRYLMEGGDLNPEIVLIGFAPVNLRRIENVFRPFVSQGETPLSKPRYVLESGELRLIPPPLPDRAALESLLDFPLSVRSLGVDDEWYRPWVYDNPLYDYSALMRLSVSLGGRIYYRYLSANRLIDGPVFSLTSSAFALQVAVMRQFVADVEANGQTPIVLFLPDFDSVGNMSVGKAPVYGPLADVLTGDGVDWLDAGEALTEHPVLEDLFAPNGHYSILGNDLVGEWLGGVLLSLYPRHTS